MYINRMTIYDFAKELQLSAATVSKALNGYPDVGPKTRARVLAKAAELGFEPNIAARSITTKKSQLIGVLFSNIHEGLLHPHFAEILEHFRNAVEAGNYEMVFIADQPGKQRSLWQACQYRAVEGVLVVSYDASSEEFATLMNSPLPVVLVSYEWPGCSSVLSDNGAGMRVLVDYLYDCGHRDFAYISAPLEHVSGAGWERFAGVRDALAEKGLRLTERNTIVAASLGAKSGYNAATEMLSREMQATAVITAYDRLAVGAIDCFERSGLHVPEDISVTGFDDLPSDLDMLKSLTTMRQQRDKIGKLAAELLLKQISAGRKLTEPIRLPVELVPRTSTKIIKEP